MSERRCHLTGWWVFVGSAVCFIVAGVRSGDPLTIVGGVLFLLGCLIFLYPMAFSRGTDDRAVCCECGCGVGEPRNGPGAEQEGA